MRSYRAAVCYLLLSWISVCGCSSLSPFRVYTSSSGRGMDAIEKIDYRFVQQCEANCRDRDLAANSINRLACNCEDSKRADSVNMLMYEAVYQYISSLGKLAEPKLTNYPIKQLGSSVSNTKIIRVSEQEIDAFNTLSDLISQAITHNYRQDKLKAYIISARVPFNTLVSALQLNFEKNLKGAIEVRKQRIRSDYYELLSHKQNTAYEKRKITEDYYQITEHLDQHIKSLGYFSAILEEIKVGHQQIYQNLDRLSSTELQNALVTQASKIDGLIELIDKK